MLKHCTEGWCQAQLAWKTQNKITLVGKSVCIKIPSQIGSQFLVLCYLCKGIDLNRPCFKEHLMFDIDEVLGFQSNNLLWNAEKIRRDTFFI